MFKHVLDANAGSDLRRSARTQSQQTFSEAHQLGLVLRIGSFCCPTVPNMSVPAQTVPASHSHHPPGTSITGCMAARQHPGLA